MVLAAPTKATSPSRAPRLTMKTETSGLLEPRLAEAPRRRLWLALSHLLLALIMLAKVGGDFTLSAALKTLFHLHAEDTAGLTVASTDQVVGAGTVAYLMGKLAAGPTVRLVGARVASFCMLVIFLLSMITIGVGHSDPFDALEGSAVAPTSCDARSERSRNTPHPPAFLPQKARVL